MKKTFVVKKTHCKIF